MKVISFSLYGNNNMYIQGAFENIKLAKIYYPDWNLHFYCDDSIRNDIVSRISNEGATVIRVDKNINPNGLTWRWLPFYNENVDIWISRDCDSRLNERESKAVSEWLSTDKSFHIMRDAHDHHVHIMCGMFGVNNKLFKNRYKNISFDVVSTENDQVLLKNKIWPVIIDDHLSHNHWLNKTPVCDIDNLTNYIKEKWDNNGVFFNNKSIHKNFPYHKPIEYGLYIGQVILEDNSPYMPFYVKNEYIIRGVDPLNKPNVNEHIRRLVPLAKNHTSLPIERLLNLADKINICVTENIYGSFLECGVQYGGTVCFMHSLTKSLESKDRPVHAFDSFEGLPVPQKNDIAVDGSDAYLMYKNNGFTYKDCDVPIERFQETLRDFNINDIIIHKGWFKDTTKNFNESIAILRLDGDWYESTMDCLENLYPRVVKGGFVIIDDYGYWKGCKEAIHEYFNKYNIKVDLVYTDKEEAWFRVQ